MSKRDASRFGNVRQLPSGRWQARYIDRSGRPQNGPRTFRTETEARKFLTRVEIEMEQGLWLDPKKAKTPFVDLVDSWNAGRPTVRLTTRTSDANYLSSLILPFFGEMRADQIGPETIRDWYTWAADRPKYANTKKPSNEKLSRNTIAKAYRTIRAIFEVAVEDGIMASNPCRLRGAATEQTPEQRAATAVQVQLIAEAIDPRYKALVLVGAYGGLRIGELIGLERRRVDFKTSTIRVVEQVTQPGGKVVVGPPKTDAGVRTVELPPEVMLALRVHMREYAEPGKSGLVFPAPKGGYLRRTNFTRRVWQPALAKAGIEKLRFHDLRHTHATLAVHAGTDTRSLMARMGHASPRASLIYQHAQTDDGIAARFSPIIAEAAKEAAKIKAAAELAEEEAEAAEAGAEDPSGPRADGTPMARPNLRIVE